MRCVPGLLLVLLCLCSGPSRAESWVYRCEDVMGRTIYSDKPCHAIDALPLPGPNDPPPRISGPTASVPAGPAVEEEFDPADMPRPVETEGCAGPDPGRLASALADALSAADTNRIAAMFHWQGARRGTASQVFRRIGSWIAQAPLRTVLVRDEHADDWLFAGLPPPAPENVLLPEIELLDGGERSVGRLGLVRNAGCVWLRPY